MKKLNLLVVTWSLAIFSSWTFTVCVLYGLITPESLHMHDFLEMVLPGFKWGSLPRFSNDLENRVGFFFKPSGSHF